MSHMVNAFIICEHKVYEMCYIIPALLILEKLTERIAYEYYLLCRIFVLILSHNTQKNTEFIIAQFSDSKFFLL